MIYTVSFLLLLRQDFQKPISLPNIKSFTIEKTSTILIGLKIRNFSKSSYRSLIKKNKLKKRFRAGQVTYLFFKKFKKSNKSWFKMVFSKTTKAFLIQIRKWSMWDPKLKDYAGLWMSSMKSMFKNWKSRGKN